MWWNKYIGEEYTEENDCMALAVRVAKDVLDKEVESPPYKPNIWSQAKAVGDFKDGVCKRTDTAEDGNPVLFLCRKRFYHIGVLVHTNNEQYVLHADQQAGFVLLTRLRDMAEKGYEFEGFYKWI